MKMKSPILLIAATAALLPLSANAALLVGFHEFDATASGEASAPSLTAAGFSGSVIEGTASVATGGSSTDSVLLGLSGVTGDNDGYLRALDADFPIIQVDNISGGSYTLDSLVFDAGSQGGGGTFTVSYRLGTSGAWTVIPTADNPTGSLPVVGGAGNSSSDYLRVVLDLVGLLPAFDTGDVIQFSFVPSVNGRIDNIALTGTLSPIPEPGSLLALGGLVGAGCLLRSRRRAMPVASA